MLNLAPINDLLNQVWAEMEAKKRESVALRAKENPKAWKDCRQMEDGKSTAYRYYESKIARIGQTTRWCYTKHRNVAGYYLSFIEVWTGKRGARTAWIGWDTKAAAIENCKARYDDAKKPKNEQRYTIPTYNKIAKST